MSLQSAQRKYDNRMPEDGELPEPPDAMDCPGCGATVRLDYDSCGTCDECHTECKFDFDQF